MHVHPAATDPQRCRGSCRCGAVGAACAHLQVPYPHDALAAPNVAYACKEEQLCDGSPPRRLHCQPQQPAPVRVFNETVRQAA